MKALSAQASGPPALWLTCTEYPRAALDLCLLPSLALPLLALAPKGDGHPVIVLPGFATSDLSTFALRSFLGALGYDVRGWGLGRNWGPRVTGPGQRRLIDRIAELHEQSGRSVTLVGWSLGGIMARKVAFRRPDLVRQVLSIGSPIKGEPRHTRLWPLYSAVTGDSQTDIMAMTRLPRTGAGTPMFALHSRTDGIVPWQNCLEDEAGVGTNVPAGRSHLGLVFNAAVLLHVAEVLAALRD